MRGVDSTTNISKRKFPTGTTHTFLRNHADDSVAVAIPILAGLHHQYVRI